MESNYKIKYELSPLKNLIDRIESITISIFSYLWVDYGQGAQNRNLVCRIQQEVLCNL